MGLPYQSSALKEVFYPGLYMFLSYCLYAVLIYETAASNMNADVSPSSNEHPGNNSPQPIQMGPRATKLRSAMTFSLRHTLKACSQDHFKKAFPKLSGSESLESARLQIIDFLKTSAEEEFDAILRHHGAVERLNAWDEAIEEAKENKHADTAHATARPNPSLVITASRVASKKAELERLKGLLRNVEAENTAMRHKLVELKDTLRDAGLDRLSATARNLQNVVTSYESVSAMGPDHSPVSKS
ncbi:hypothetical protein SeMB42_g03808 [Synchytrium endobioticum]|uniref:Uncharacterized protein n=1 Tax=Synchytrium endobioticum TaxID=286115 RepID=A0A507D4D5_9FUNG|nr:hypothetical protein SeMB42_g03808 [Synchytrium endobioticum]